MITPIRIATRGSRLAMWQANHVADRLRTVITPRGVELVEVSTTGDQIRDQPLSQIGGQGLFTKEIQTALLTGRADVAVHSLKDLPTDHQENLVLAAVPPRARTEDALISIHHRSFEALPQGAVIATSSTRRRAQLLHRRPDLRLVEIRGNVDTRLKKLREAGLDALILAVAGLERLGLRGEITEVLDPEWMIPAVGQGALGIECRYDDVTTQAALQALDDPTSHTAVLAERAFLRALGGGCLLPIAAHCLISGDELYLRGCVCSADGKRRLHEVLTAKRSEPVRAGEELAHRMLAQGARALLGV